MNIHITRSIDFYNALSEGEFLPRWAGNLNAGYGYPLFEFIYPLPYFLIFFVKLIGFSFTMSTKLVLMLSFIASGIAMFYWIKEKINAKAGLIAGMFYLFAPYHLVDLHFRADIGEIVAFTFVPLVLLGIDMLPSKKWQHGLLLGAGSYAALILSHQAVSLSASALFVGYVGVTIFQQKNKAPVFLKSIVLLLSGLLLSAFYWLPAIFESHFTHQLFMKELSYVPLSELLYSHWRFGLLFQGPSGQLSFLIGYAHILVTIICIFLLIKHKVPQSLRVCTVFFALIFCATIFMLVPTSEFVWKQFDLLLRFQFTCRLLVLVAVATSFFAGIISTKISNKALIGLICVAVLSTILNWSNRNFLDREDTFFQQELPIATLATEGLSPAMPIWQKNWQPAPATEKISFLTGTGTSTAQIYKNSFHQYKISVQTPAIIQENTLYFPGWIVTVNNQEITVTTKQTFSTGLITFPLEPGEYTVQVHFSNTPIRKIGNALSSIVAICLLIWGSRYLPKKNNKV